MASRSNNDLLRWIIPAEYMGVKDGEPDGFFKNLQGVGCDAAAGVGELERKEAEGEQIQRLVGQGNCSNSDQVTGQICGSWLA